MSVRLRSTYNRRLFAAILAALAFACFGGLSVRAQNLITNPNFTNGLAGYFSVGATASTFGGVTGADITPGGFVEATNLATTPGVNYVFTFLAIAANPDVPAAFTAEFNPISQSNNSSGVGTLIQTTLTNSGLTLYQVVGTATSSSSFAFVGSTGSGDLFVTAYDLQPAPAPVVGGGILSFCAVFAGLAASLIRRRVGLRGTLAA